MPGRRIAAFDFDGTLTHRDTVVPFLVAAFGRPAVARAAAEVAPTAADARFGRRRTGAHPRDVTKAALLRRLTAGRPADWFADRGRRFADTLDRRLRPEMMEQALWHRSEGHELVLVSASLATYLGPFAEAHGFDHVIAVELAHDAGGVLTGELDGPNVRGPEKATRFQSWLDGDEPDVLWAYGNSSGDAELLALADIPVWVGRQGRTARP